MKAAYRTLSVTLLAAFMVGLATSAVAQEHAVRLALDWVPNTNHTGVFVALEKGWYEEEGVELDLLPFGNVLTNVLVRSGRADVGILGTQGVLASHATGEPVVSIAAIVSTNTAALAVLEESGIGTAAELDGKIYASFGGPVEGPIIEAVIEHAGGKGDFKSALLSLAGFDALLSGRADFVWIYEGWQGVQAEREGVDLRLFNFVDYGIPDHYNPVFIASPEGIEQKHEALKAFIRATRRGYEFAVENPVEAAELLLRAAPQGSFPEPGLVRDSQEYLSQVYAEPGKRWGVQTWDKWSGFSRFLLDAGVFSDADGNTVTSVDIEEVYSNELMPEASD